MEHTSFNLPDWMSDPFETGHMNKRARSLRFLSKTLRNIQTTLAEGLRNETLAASPGLAQKLDPRIKLICTVLLILAASLAHSITGLVLLGVFTTVIMAASRLPVWSLQRRIWGIIPLLTLAAALPATLSFFNPGTPLLMINDAREGWQIFGIHINGPIYISQQGANAAFIIFLRVGVSLSLGSLLVLTTPVASLLRSLRVLGVPSLFVMIIEMSYRYIALLLTSSLEMFEARKMRTIGNLPGSVQRALVGSSIAAVFNRSISLSEEVYQAMTARGYTGEALIADPFEFKPLDFAALTIIIGLAFLVILGGSVVDWQHILPA